VEESVTAVDITPGTRLTSGRTITAQDVATVARITGDTGMHHVSGLAGRQVAQGLLTVAVAPLLGPGDGFRIGSARTTFLAPVFVGDTVTCAVSVDQVAERADGARDVRLTLRITNQDGAEVVVGEADGVLAAPDGPPSDPS
jgi:acyl dehydratase